MFCRNCGAELKDDAQFCTECGTAIESVQSDKAAVKKKPTPYIIIAVIAVFVVILAVVVIMLLLKGNKYMRIVKAYENTLNADSMFLEFECIEDEEILQAYIKAEIVGKGDDATIACYGHDGDYDDIYVAWDSDNIYYYNGICGDMDNRSEFEAAYNSVAERDMSYMYEYLEIDDALDMSYDEFYNACIGFIKDYYKNKDSIRVECDVKDSDDSYKFELNIRDFIDYVEKNNDYRMSTKLYEKIPDEALLIMELTLDGEYFDELKASLEYEHFRSFELTFKFSEINEISKKESDARQFIDDFVVVED